MKNLFGYLKVILFKSHMKTYIHYTYKVKASFKLVKWMVK